KRNFRLERLCLFSHGGAIHDTIATIERSIIEKAGNTNGVKQLNHE
ncbi:MAG: hypothetical protein JWQ66_1758, partial [Mucilaginibacter sp.]|nr:hypothetical protein [Mucilaginibacter sp.]